MGAIPRHEELATREACLADFIPFNTPITESIVKNSDGSYLATWRLDGISFEAQDPEDIELRHDSFNSMVRSLGFGVALWSHRLRRKISDRLETDYEEPVAKEIATKYYQTFQGYRMMANEFYLTLVYKPPRAKQASEGLSRFFSRQAMRSLEQIRHDEAEDLKKMAEFINKMNSSLREYDPTLLGDYVYEDDTFNRQREFYAYLVNGYWKPVRSASYQSISQSLPTTRQFVQDELIELRGPKGSKYVALLDLQDYPPETSPGIINLLLYLDYEFIETMSFTIMSKRQAEGAIKLQQKQLRASEDIAASQVEALNRALDDLGDGVFCYGEFHYSLAVFGDSPAAARKNLSGARTTLEEAGFQTALIDLLADGAWFSQLPGNWKYRPREAKLTSRNYCGMSAFHGFAMGKRNGNPWGEAVTVLKTPNGNPYYFNWHATRDDVDSFDDKAPGNTTIIGATGTGKTVVELFLMMMSLKYKPTILFWDKDRGAEIAIRALGGNYRTFKRGVPTGLNPLQLPVNPQNTAYNIEFIKERVPRRVTPKEEEQITAAVTQVLKMEMKFRRLSMVHQQLPNTDDDGVAAHLAKWCATTGGSLAWVADNPELTIDFSSDHLLGFDDTDLLESPEVLDPITSILLHMANSLIDGRRFMYFMAEFWKRLELPACTDFAVNKQYTIRKQNGFGVFDTQSPAQILKTPHVAAMVEQSATQIFLPNPKASYDDYVNGFSLTKAEFETIKSFEPHSRQMLIKQGHGTAIVTLDLGGLGEYLNILSSSTDNLAVLDEIRAEVGDDPEIWMPIFKEKMELRKAMEKEKSLRKQ